MAHMNLERYGKFGKLLEQKLERPYRGVVEVNDDSVEHNNDGILNMAKRGGRPKKWAVLKFWTQEDRKKPNKRKIEDKIKELMKKEEEEEEEDLSESVYYKNLIKKEKTAKKWKKRISNKDKWKIKAAERTKKKAQRAKIKGGGKRTRKKRGGGDWEKMENSELRGYEKKKRLNERQYKYYLDYGEDIKPYHADFMITGDENGGYIHLNKFGKELTLAREDHYQNGINYAIETLKELHEKNIFHGDIVSGDTEIKWNKGNILFNVENGEAQYKLIDFGPTDGEKRSDKELIQAEKNMLKMKIGRDEAGNLRAPPSIKKPRRPKNMYGHFSPRAPGQSFMSRLDEAEDTENSTNQANRLFDPGMLFSSPSSSPKRPSSQELGLGHKKRGKLGFGKRKSTKKKRKRKRKSTKKKRRRRR